MTSILEKTARAIHYIEESTPETSEDIVEKEHLLYLGEGVLDYIREGFGAKGYHEFNERYCTYIKNHLQLGGIN